MPGDLSRGQFVIVCQPVYTVNTTNCRLIQMSTGAQLADAYPRGPASSFEAALSSPRLEIPPCTHEHRVIRAINLGE